MNIQELKTAINSDLPDDFKEQQIIQILAKDKNVMPTVLKILSAEREYQKEILDEINLNLSRTHIFIEAYTPDLQKLKKVESVGFTKQFVLDKVEEFYTNYPSIRHLFNRFL